MNKRIICMVLAIPLAALGQPAVFNFDSGEIPASCVLDSGRTAQPKGNFVQPGTDETRASGVFITEDEGRGGVFIRSPRADDDVMGQALSAFTVCLAFRASSPLSASPIFLERLVGSTSGNAGFFRFRSQSNSGSDNERRCTFRFGVKSAKGEDVNATSTVPWIQQENVWNWVGMVFDKGRVTFYLNGERAGDDIHLPVEEIPAADGKSYYIRGGYGFVGAFDDLAFIPGKAFTDDEMQEAYKQGISSEEILRKIKE